MFECVNSGKINCAPPLIANIRFTGPGRESFAGCGKRSRRQCRQCKTKKSSSAECGLRILLSACGLRLQRCYSGSRIIAKNRRVRMTFNLKQLRICGFSDKQFADFLFLIVDAVPFPSTKAHAHLETVPLIQQKSPAHLQRTFTFYRMEY